MSVPRGPLSVTDRLRKLRGMTVDELWTRVHYDAYCRWEGRRHGHGPLIDETRFRDALVPALRQNTDWQQALVQARRESNRRFFASIDDLASIRRTLLEQYPGEVERMRVEADRALRLEFAFFGEKFTYEKRVDWHADPVTRARWPQVYHRRVPVHGGDVGFGDVKHVWELSRHQFLIDLAKGWAVLRDAEYARAARELAFDWRRENPVGTGVAWSCALEPAFRVLSWLWAYHLTDDDLSFDTESHVRWLCGFYEHGWFLHRHLEYYTSPYNHLIGEACALYALGVLFPEFAEAGSWRARGRHILESRLASQFYADGGSVEQSTFYHHATTGFYLIAALIGRANGEEFSPAIWSAIERAIEFSAALQQPDGTIPRIGGADDGKPIRLEHRELWDFRPYQAVGAVLFNRGDFKALSGDRFPEDALWLLGMAGAKAFASLPDTAPPPSRALPSSGYVVLRDGWTRQADYVCFDCGEQAAGLRKDDIPSAAHGHADALSVIVWRRGEPVLVDAGFHCYNGPKPWQDHFRETAAHNTIRIDGRDQAVHINKMAWSHTYTAHLERHDIVTDDAWAVGSHDGYRALPRGSVTHRRAIWTRRAGYVVIGDFLEGAGHHDVEIVFQFAPGELVASHNCVTFNDRAALHWCASFGTDGTIHKGAPTPDGGWIAPSLGVKHAAPRLVISGQTQMPAVIVSIIVDVHASSPRVTLTEDDGGRRLLISGAGWTDALQVHGLTGPPVESMATDALIAAWRLAGDQWVPSGYVAGTFQRAGVER